MVEGRLERLATRLRALRDNNEFLRRNGFDLHQAVAALVYLSAEPEKPQEAADLEVFEKLVVGESERVRLMFLLDELSRAASAEHWP